MAGTRSYVSGNFMFNLDGVKCGFVKSVEGGDVTAEVVEEKQGPDKFTKKHIGQPKYEDFDAEHRLRDGAERLRLDRRVVGDEATCARTARSSPRTRASRRAASVSSSTRSSAR